MFLLQGLAVPQAKLQDGVISPKIQFQVFPCKLTLFQPQKAAVETKVARMHSLSLSSRYLELNFADRGGCWCPEHTRPRVQDV